MVETILASIGAGMGLRSLFASEILGRKSIAYWVKYWLVLNQEKSIKPIECDACLTFWAAIVLWQINPPEFVISALIAYFCISLVNKIWI